MLIHSGGVPRFSPARLISLSFSSPPRFIFFSSSSLHLTLYFSFSFCIFFMLYLNLFAGLSFLARYFIFPASGRLRPLFCH